MTIERMVGVYDADGGVAGELRYLAGRLRGRHCSLCDLTHGAVSERREFRRAADDLPVPLALVHRNEQEPGLAGMSDRQLPGVFGFDGQRWTVLLGPADLAPLHADVPAFDRALRATLARANGRG